MKEGYLAQIDAGPNLFLGEALVCAHDNYIYIFTQ